MAAMVQTTTAGVVTSHPNDYEDGSRFAPSDYRIGSRFRLSPFSSLLERRRQVANHPLFCDCSEFGQLLGMPVVPNSWGKTLYLAMDRPRQAARSFRRMVGEAWRDELDSTLMVWDGPPLVDIAKNPVVLKNMAREVGAETLIVDSLKDAAIGLSEDEGDRGSKRSAKWGPVVLSMDFTRTSREVSDEERHDLIPLSTGGA